MGKPAGTLGDIGVFSLNVHKTINCGEGGVCVTNDDELADRMRLIRNHAEVVVKDKGTKNIVNLIGFNYRMCEIEAAIASEQLKKIDSLIAARIANAEYLAEKLSPYPGITPPEVKHGVRHGYYNFAVKFDASKADISREIFARAMNAEGIPTNGGYVEPIYLEPIYQRLQAYGSSGCPFTCQHSQSINVSYKKGICPVTERMHYDELIIHELVHKGMLKSDLDDIISAYEKVLEAAPLLGKLEE